VLPHAPGVGHGGGAALEQRDSGGGISGTHGPLLAQEDGAVFVGDVEPGIEGDGDVGQWTEEVVSLFLGEGALPSVVLHGPQPVDVRPQPFEAAPQAHDRLGRVEIEHILHRKPAAHPVHLHLGQGHQDQKDQREDAGHWNCRERKARRATESASPV
jgi:hypothetical protein